MHAQPSGQYLNRAFSFHADHLSLSDSAAALQLLAMAAQDPHSRQSGFISSPSPDFVQRSSRAGSCSDNLDNSDDATISSIILDLVEDVANSCATSLDASIQSQSDVSSTMDTATCSFASSSPSLTAFKGGDSSGHSDSILRRLLDAVQNDAWTRGMSSGSLLCLVKLLSSYAHGSDIDRQLLATAARGRPISVLLHLYRSVEHDHQTAHPTAQQPEGMATLPPCCAACHTALSAALSLCSGSSGSAQLRAEAFVTKPGKARTAAVVSVFASPTAGTGSGQLPRPKVAQLLSPTPLLGEIVQGTRTALKHCRQCTVPELAWDGSVKAYVKGKTPADPCCGGDVQQGTLPAAPAAKGGSLLEKWVMLLAAASCGKTAVRELYRRHMTDVLEEVLEAACHGAAGTSLLEAVEAAFGASARHSQVSLISEQTMNGGASRGGLKTTVIHLVIHGRPLLYMALHHMALFPLVLCCILQFISQDICESGSVAALTGMALHSHEPRLALVALDRLVPLAETCGGLAFVQQLARSGGALAAAHQMALLAAASQDGSQQGNARASAFAGSVGGGRARFAVHPWDAAVDVSLSEAAAAAAALVAGSRTAGVRGPAVQPPPLIDHGASQSGAIRDAACSLLLAGLDRARRMAGLKAMQVRCGAAGAPMVAQ